MGKLIALVTGGNGGIGLAAANQFVERGAYVFVTGQSRARVGSCGQRDWKKCNRRAGRRIEPWRSR